MVCYWFRSGLWDIFPTRWTQVFNWLRIRQFDDFKHYRISLATYLPIPTANNPIPIMSLPPRFVDLKRSIASSYPDFQARATNAWREIITELDKVTKVIKEEGLNVGAIILWSLKYNSSNSRNSTFLRSISARSTVFPKTKLKRSKGVEVFW